MIDSAFMRMQWFDGCVFGQSERTVVIEIKSEWVWMFVEKNL